jgi:hypothetical protein
MNKTTYDRGLEQGEVRGAQRALLRLGRRKFDEPSPEILIQLRQISDVDRLESLVARVFDVSSWEELLRDA